MALPTDWTTIQAVAKWDGRSGLTYESAQVDQFASSGKNVSGVAARWNRDLAAYTRFWISWITRYHGQTCPVEPNSRTAATIGGQPGVLLAYNCGILINQAITVHNGVGYDFLFRDPSVAAASNPADHAMFMTMLSSIRFPAAVGFTQR